MGSGKSLIDQIQNVLHAIEESGSLDELAVQTDAEDDAQERVAPLSQRPDGCQPAHRV